MAELDLILKDYEARASRGYGPLCYAARGCAEIVEALSQRFDARTINPDFPAYFPRLVQASIWSFCAQGGMDVCNGNRIDDARRCENSHCPASDVCDRVALRVGD